MTSEEPKHKILIIDDEESMRELVDAGLDDAGFQTYTATCGEEGVRAALQHRPDLILCDIRMPGMDGYATLQTLKKLEPTASIPVILMTGALTDYSHLRQGMDIGADDYIMKPFMIPDLIDAIRSRLRKQQSVVSHAEAKLSTLRENIGLSLPHELRTPLVSILGFATVLQQNYQTLDREDIGKIAAGLHRSGTRLHELIERFLLYTEVEMLGADAEAVQHLRRESTPGIHLLLRALAHQRAAEASRQDDLILELNECCGSISAHHLTTVMTGLIDNAFKFSDPGTPITLRCSAEGSRLSIILSDEGRGMTPEQVASIGGYMQFGRKLYEQQGFGLGLITAKRLIEIYAGSMNIQSETSQGTSITIMIPNGTRD
jgi:CheY-like chemotaxis protein/anti-sigma regulatory factor (Ser/Thr protein kinase)